GHSCSSPLGTRTTTPIVSFDSLKNRVFRYLNNHIFVEPGTNVFAPSVLPRNVTTVPDFCSLMNLGKGSGVVDTTNSSCWPIGMRSYWLRISSQPTCTIVLSPLFQDLISRPFLCRVGPAILRPMP